MPVAGYPLPIVENGSFIYRADVGHAIAEHSRAGPYIGRKFIPLAWLGIHNLDL